MMNHVMKQLQSHFILLVGLDKLIIKNKCGINGVFTIELNCPIKFNDFIEALYKIKSNKEDKWYELYRGCELVDNCLSVYFDHGS